MNALKSLGVLVLAGGSLVAASRLASAGTTTSSGDQRLVVLPVSLDGPAVELASLGVAELTPDDGAPIAALHLQAVLANTDDDQPWAVDMARARVELVAGEPIAAAFVNSDARTLPIAIIARGERRVVDLYFPIPRELAAHGPAAFTLTWPMNRPPHRALHARFTSERITAQTNDGVARAAGWGPRWWFAPTYPWPEYLHRPGYVTSRPPRRVTVTQPPRWDASGREPRDPVRDLRECNRW